MTRWLDVLRLRVRSLTRGDAIDRELQRELQFHLDARVNELVADGADAAAARLQAQREFGSTTSVTQQCRETRRVSVAANLMQDLRYASRILRAQPMLLVAATTSIALGVGVNLSIFGLANELLMSTPTARATDELVHIKSFNGSHVSHAVWRDIASSDVMAGLVGHRLETDVNWRDRNGSATIMPLVTTPNFFDVLGVPVAIGRGFTADEADTSREPRLAVVSDRFFRTRLGGDPAIIGQSLTLNGDSYTVLGVLPAEFRSLPGFGLVPDMYLALNRALVGGLDNPRAGTLQLVGRLKPGQSIDQARAAFDTIGARIAEVYHARDMGRVRTIGHVGGITQLGQAKEVTLFFGVLFVVSILVLTIACANVAGLLLARATARQREIALRLALGATRRRLLQQLLTEGFLLSLCGVAAGLAITAGLMRVVTQISLPIPFPIELHVDFDARLITLAAAMVVISTLLCGLMPALQATRPALSPAFKHDVTVFGYRRWNVRTLVVTGQVAVSVLLLVVTVLFLRNLGLARGLSPEFDAARGVVAQVTFVEGRQGSVGAPAVANLVDEVQQLPGVESAAIAAGVPLTIRYGGETGTEMRIEGQDQPVPVRYFNNAVGPRYFEALGLKVLRGRDFITADRSGAPRVIVINQEFAERYFAGHDPIGKHVVNTAERQGNPAQVIGVVSNSKYSSIGEDRAASVYSSILQGGGAGRFAHIVVRTNLPPESLTGAIGSVIAAFDASAAYTVEPMTTSIAFAFLPSRIGAVLVGALGTLGMLLAMIGLYGTVSYAVSRRTSEIGIRVALGASRGAVLRLVMKEGGLLVFVGLALGLALAVAATSPLRAFLVADLSTTDAFSYIVTVAVLGLTSLVACWSPARRATRVQPATALRAE